MEIRIKCENTNSEILVKAGTTLKELAEQTLGNTIGGMPILAALVDNKLNSLDYKIILTECIIFSVKRLYAQKKNDVLKKNNF